MSRSFYIEWQPKRHHRQLDIVGVEPGPVYTHKDHFPFSGANVTAGGNELQNFVVGPWLAANGPGITETCGGVRKSKGYAEHALHGKREEQGCKHGADAASG